MYAYMSFMCSYYSKKLLGSHSGTIFSPNWPLQYPTGAVCNWTIDLPPSTIAQFFFTSFRVEFTTECNPDRAFFVYDNVRIDGEFKKNLITQSLAPKKTFPQHCGNWKFHRGERGRKKLGTVALTVLN